MLKNFLWFLGGATLIAAVYTVMNQQAGITASADGVDEAGTKAGLWGTAQRGFGFGGQLKGKLEQGVGSLTGDETLTNQGVFDEVAGSVKGAAGKLAQVVGKTIQDLKK